MTVVKDSTYYLKRFEKLLDEKIENGPRIHLDFKYMDIRSIAEEQSMERHLAILSCYLEISEAWIKALKEAVQDSGFSEKKKYVVRYIMTPYLDFDEYKTGELVEKYYTKAELLTELEEVNLENFGDDLEEWESWLQAWKMIRPI